MSEKPISEGEITAWKKRRWRVGLRGMVRMLLMMFAGYVCLFILVAAIGLVDRNGLLLRAGIARDTTDAVVRTVRQIGSVAIFFVSLRFAVRNKPADDLFEEKYTRARIDVLQARWRWFAILYLAFAAAFIFYLQRKPADFNNGFPILVIIFSGAGATCFGPRYLNRGYNRGLSDELQIALRAKATTAGYLGLIALLAGLYSFTRTQALPMDVVLPWILYGGIVIPTLSFLFFDWRASRGG